MSKQTTTEDLRAPAGLLDSGYRIFIPRIFENGDYKLPSRHSSILKGLLKWKSSRFLEGGRFKLQSRLMRDFGISRSMSAVISNRSVKQIRRNEQVVHGIIDSLLLFDHTMFITLDGYMLLKHIVRKVLITSCFNINQVVTYWKSYTNSVFVQASDSEVLEYPKVEKENFFSALETWPKIQRIREGLLTKKDLTDLSQLISSRQLPCGDKSTELKALEEFKVITSQEYLPDSEILTDLYQAARIIGRKCRKAGTGPIGNAHISLATAGSFSYTVEEGGRAQEIKNSVTPYLSFIPEEDGTITLPFTSLRDVKGVPRWRTWCRDETFEGYPFVDFGEITPEFLNRFNVFRQGFDEAIGEQILVCAYLAMQDEYSKEGIPLRVITVAEPGCKARIVTTGPWWLYVLQQSSAHVTRGFLSSHPSAEAGMARTDQAWQYLYQIVRAREFYEPSFSCLSSDLKSATDAIPHQVAISLLEGFSNGLGYLSPLLETAMMLIATPRICLARLTDETFGCTRGVFMGEPLAKTVLTLLNLSCEEVAIRKFLNVGFNVPVQVPWRTFAVAGDDHIAIGPVDYLKEVTATHIRSGTIISKTKHAISKRFVLYCEKIIDIRNIFNLEWTPKNINDDISMYITSPHIDSIKVRLLSPCSKNNESFNDRNTAVGKASSLGNTLRWISSEIYNYKFKSMIRDRFFMRMGSLLPDRSSGVYWHLLLPSKFGGLGLYMDQDLEDLTIKLPSPTKSFLIDYCNGTESPEQANFIRGFTSNISYRGYTLLETEITLVKSEVVPGLIEYLTMMGAKYTHEEAVLLKGIDSTLSLKQQQSRLRGATMLTEKEVEDLILRPFLFKQILSGEAKTAAFNTESFKKRYSRFWDVAYQGECSITTKTLKDAIEKGNPYPYVFDFSERMEVPIHGKMVECTLLEEATIGMPNLHIRNIQVGLLVQPTNQTDFSLGEYV